MKRNIFIAASLLLMSALTFTSCSDFLEADNRTNREVSKLSSSEALTQAYYDMRTIFQATSASGELQLFTKGTDLYIPSRNDADDIHQYKITPETSVVEDLYTNLYKVIDDANWVISICGEGNYASADCCEAYFLRALAYYYLTQQFGKVPLMTEVLKTAERSFPRAELSEIYSKMLTDLGTVYAAGSLETCDYKTGHASKAAVAGLIAKYNLAAAWDLGTTLTNASEGTYQKNNTADAYFSSAIQFADYAMSAAGTPWPMAKAWNPSNDGTVPNFIFSLQYSRTASNTAGTENSDGNGWQDWFGGYYNNRNPDGFKQQINRDCPSQKVIGIFDNDPRWFATFMDSIYAYDNNKTPAYTWPATGYYAYYNSSDDELHTKPMAFKYLAPWEDMPATSKEETPCVKQLVAGSKFGTAKAVMAKMASTVVYREYDGNQEPVKYNPDKVSVPYPTIYPYSSSYLNNVYEGLCVKKFDDPKTPYDKRTTLGYRPVVLINYNDLMLVKAEAQFMLNNPDDALATVNTLRKNEGVATIASLSSYAPAYNASPYGYTSQSLSMLDLILDERARELYAEGYRWMDLRRTKQLVKYYTLYSPYRIAGNNWLQNDGIVRWYRPIPQKEIDANTGMTSADQNPGY